MTSEARRRAGMYSVLKSMPSGQLVSAAWEGESRDRAMMAGEELVGLERRRVGDGNGPPPLWLIAKR